MSRRSLGEEDNYDDKCKTLMDIYISMYIPVQLLGGFVNIYQETFNICGEELLNFSTLLYNVCKGYFTVGARLYYSFMEMMLYNFASAVMGLVFFGILVGTSVVPANGDAVLLTVVLLSNTFGLAVLMILLGYGLVSFPRMLWDMGNIERELGYMQHKAASRFKTMNEASLNVSLAVSDVLKTKQEVRSEVRLDDASNSICTVSGICRSKSQRCDGHNSSR